MNVRTYLMHDYDLWMVIVELQKYLKFGVTFEWIKSHQCSSQSPPPTNDEIKLQEQKIRLNDNVNKLVTAAYTDESDYVKRGDSYSGEVCYHQDGAHIQDISKAISSIDSDYDIIQYYLSKGWSMDRLKRVEWVGMETFLSNQSPITCCNTIQMMHDWQNTGSQKKKFYEQSASLDGNISINDEKSKRLGKCPLGCNHQEDPFHFVKCKADVMYTTRETGLLTLSKGLKK
jgi:hypothetical protein